MLLFYMQMIKSAISSTSAQVIYWPASHRCCRHPPRHRRQRERAGCSSRASQSAGSFCHSCSRCLSALAHSTRLYHPGVWLLSPWVVAAVQREANCIWIDVFTPLSAACEWTGRPLTNSLAACSSTAFFSLKSFTARSRC
jgi:hypothetical protein